MQQDIPVKINIAEIPPVEGRLLGQTFAEYVKRFYEKPDNVTRFNEWKRNKEDHQNER